MSPEARRRLRGGGQLARGVPPPAPAGVVSTFRLIEGKYDVDDPDDFGELLADLARRCDVPVWLAARHLADTGVLLSAAGLDDL